ncbi:MAG: Oligopeptide/dipeptide transporter, C-terminal region [Microbacteriaceae bacterium]|nr:Oligopeptide/dipeptide transporter, C-terminal region [Microbacteriaceae bacterium]
MQARILSLMTEIAGEFVEQGTVADVFAPPQHPYTRTLHAAQPRLGGRAIDHVAA